MRQRNALRLILGFVVVLVVSLSQGVRAGKPVDNNPHPDGIFDNSEGYKITGDEVLPSIPSLPFSHTIYAHGVDGVSNTIYLSNGGGDYVQNLGGSNGQRHLNYDFDVDAGCPPAAVTCGQPNSWTDFEDAGPLNVRRVGRLDLYLEGGQLTTHGAAAFHTALGQVRFGNIENINGGPDPYGSSSLNITNLGNKWEVSTKPGDDIAALVRTIKGKQVVRLYRMPFRMIIDAPQP